MAKDILDAIYGCLIGGAVGDALGAPTEGMYYWEIKEKYGRLEVFLPNKTYYTNGKPGSITDDSTLRHYMCYAIVKKGGRITPDDFAEVWRTKLNPKRLWASETIVYERIKWGINPWEAGHGCIPAGCASMCIAPIGIINAGNPEQAYQDGYCIARVNQEGDNVDFAATLAAAVSVAFIPGSTVDDVINAMYRHSSDIVKRGLDLSLDLARKSSNIDEYAQKFYDKMLDWTWPMPYGHWNKDRYFCGHSREFVPVVPALLYLTKGDVNEGIIAGANFGRDCDTIASIVGNIAGAMQGASAIRKQWIDECEKANEDLFEELEGDKNANFYSMACRMVEALKNEIKAAEERAEALKRLIAHKENK